MARGLARFHAAGNMDCAREQKQLLRERCLAGIRVRDDGEGSPLLDALGKDFFGRFAHGMQRGTETGGMRKIVKARILT